MAHQHYPASMPEGSDRRTGRLRLSAKKGKSVFHALNPGGPAQLSHARARAVVAGETLAAPAEIAFRNAFATYHHALAHATQGIAEPAELEPFSPA